MIHLKNWACTLGESIDVVGMLRPTGLLLLLIFVACAKSPTNTNLPVSPKDTSPTEVLDQEAEASNPFCGDGRLDAGEQCDGALPASCASLNFDGGVLGCGIDCQFDTSACTRKSCGNGDIDGAEECDGLNIGGLSCVGMGYVSGSLSCSSNCGLVTSGCVSESSCEDTCSAGGMACSSGEQRVCVLQATGCYAWSLASPCASGSCANDFSCFEPTYQPSNTIFEFPHIVTTSYSYRPLVDVNDDGIIDGYTVPYDDNQTLTVMTFDAGGEVLTTWSRELGGSELHVFTALDYVGDSAVDLVVKRWTGNQREIFILPGNGDGTFGDEVFVGRGASAWLGDFNGDGRKDIVTYVTGAYYNPFVDVHIAQADGSFNTSTVFEGDFRFASYGYPQGDGNAVIALSDDWNQSELIFYQQNDAGGWGTVDLECEGCGSAPVVFADMNDDGKEDLVRAGLGQVEVYEAQTGGGFALNHALPLGAPKALYRTDVDNDGIDDVIATDRTVPVTPSGDIEIFFGSSTGAPVASGLYHGFRYGEQRPKVRDYNGDGELDLVYREIVIEGDGRRLRSPVASRFFGPAPYVYFGETKHRLDMNGDGWSDVVTASSPSFTVNLLGPDYRFASHYECEDIFSIENFPNGELTLRDLSGDGLPDLLLGNNDGLHSFPKIGDDECTFGAATVLISETASPRFVDVDGDNHVDALWWSNEGVNVRLNDGQGVFGALQTSGAGSYFWSYAMADFDGNGSEDFLHFEVVDGTIELLLNEGDGTFVLDTREADFVDEAVFWRYEAIDADRDGDMDVVYARDGDASLYLLENDGDGQFVSVNIDLGLEYAHYYPTFSLGDFTGDGYKEVMNFVSQTSSIYRLDGTWPPEKIAEYWTSDPMVAHDLDSDGDTDLYQIRKYNGHAALDVAPNYALSPE